MDLNEVTTQGWIETFSARELEVLQLLSNGLSNRAIAENLFLAIDTVKWYNKQIYLKLGVSNRTQAAKKAAELRLLELESLTKTQEEENVAGNLPAQITSYIGRKKEISEIKALLEKMKK
ncbi:MAG: LuxR C-terminal-related transcriptional regulator [Anaerolineales bacterium]